MRRPLRTWELLARAQQLVAEAAHWASELESELESDNSSLQTGNGRERDD